jgi:hypothetical protein
MRLHVEALKVGIIDGFGGASTLAKEYQKA